MMARIVNRTLQHGGATFSLATSSFAEPENYWYFPKHPSRTRIVDLQRLSAELQSFLDENADVCHVPDSWIGTWINPTSGKCYLDITTRLADKTEALRVARAVSTAEARKVVTIYNPFLHQTEHVWEGIKT